MEAQNEFSKSVNEVGSKKKNGCGKYVFITMFFLIIISSAFFYWKYYYTYSDGFRSGMLQKLSHKGNFMKTYENTFGSINFNKRYESGLRFNVNALYEDRKPLDNTTNFIFFKIIINEF